MPTMRLGEMIVSLDAACRLTHDEYLAAVEQHASREAVAENRSVQLIAQCSASGKRFVSTFISSRGLAFQIQTENADPRFTLVKLIDDSIRTRGVA